MTGRAPAPAQTVTRACSFCGFRYQGSPEECSRCGTPLTVDREPILAEGRAARRHLRHQRALSDLFFLIGLLLGGPMMTLGGELRLGLLLVLTGAFASALRRYTEWSTQGTTAIGVLLATLIAVVVVSPGEEVDEGNAVRVDTREAYVQALDAQDPDVRVEARGLNAVTIWFHHAQLLTVGCGEYPSREVRAHLADLGFIRVVVVGRSEEAGLCSYQP